MVSRPSTREKASPTFFFPKPDTAVQRNTAISKIISLSLNKLLCPPHPAPLPHQPVGIINIYEGGNLGTLRDWTLDPWGQKEQPAKKGAREEPRSKVSWQRKVERNGEKCLQYITWQLLARNSLTFSGLKCCPTRLSSTVVSTNWLVRRKW